MIRRWELVDTHHGEVLNHISRHFTRWGAEWSRLLGSFRRYRPGYELQVQRRKGTEVSEIQITLDTLDDLLTAGEGLAKLSEEDLAAVDAWANNVQLDIMRYRRASSAPHSPAEPVFPVSVHTEAHGETGEAQEARE